MADIEHLAWPPRLNAAGTTYETVEQDSPQEHAQAAALVLSTPRGTLIDNHAFGGPDLLFTTGGVDADQLRAALARWEPRIPATVQASLVEDLAQEIDVTVTSG